MPRTPRGPKRKRPPEELASSASLEVITIVRTGNRTNKKRIVEGTKFDPCPPPSVFNFDAVPDLSTLPDLNTFPAPSSDADPPQPPDNPSASKEGSSRATSRSVSVSCCHVTHRHLLTLPGPAGGVDPTSARLPTRNPSPRGPST